jgi:hypothetical protein
MFSPPLTKVDVDFSETTDKGGSKQKMLLSSSLSPRSLFYFKKWKAGGACDAL